MVNTAVKLNKEIKLVSNQENSGVVLQISGTV